MHPNEVSEMLSQIRAAEARRALMDIERRLELATTPETRADLEIKHAELVADYRARFQPNMTSPGVSRSSGVKATRLGGVIPDFRKNALAAEAARQEQAASINA